MKIDLEQLYIAYRKAKGEAFGDSNCAHGLKFAHYERHLHHNLVRLASILSCQTSAWWQDAAFLGTQSWVAKPGDTPTFRQVIDATVDYMVVAALWVIRVGHLYDRNLGETATASRVARFPDGSVNDKSLALFDSYHTACESWRKGALEAAAKLVKTKMGAVLITLDLKRFHHGVDAGFLLNPEFLEALHAKPDEEGEIFTHQFIESFRTWNAAHGFTLGLPAGLSASPLIGNVLLKEVDDTLGMLPGVAHYARYVDDVLLVMDEKADLQSTDDVFRWLASVAHPLLQSNPAQGATQHDTELQIHLPYAEGSRLIFTRSKTAVFHFSNEKSLGILRELIKPSLGADTQQCPSIDHLDQEISESVALFAAGTKQSPSAPDALTKSLMRHRSEATTLLKLLELRIWDERPSRWTPVRHNCYHLLEEFVLCPEGFFEYAKFIPRILGVMAAARDWDDASRFVDALEKIRTHLAAQAGQHRIDKGPLDGAFGSLSARMHEAVVASITQGTEEALGLCKKLAALGGAAGAKELTNSDLRRQAELLRSADWARLPYWARWIVAKRSMLWTEPFPTEIPERIFSGKEMHQFAAKVHLVAPHWPAIAFPTRRMPTGVFDDLESRQALPRWTWSAIRETLTGHSHTTHSGQEQQQASNASSYEDEGDDSWPGHILDGLAYLLHPIKANSFFDLPPDLETAHEGEDREYYVRFAQAEFDVEGEDGLMRDFWRFEGFRSDWLKTETGQQGWASDREFVEYYQTMPLAIIELEIVGGDTKRFEPLQSIASDLATDDPIDPDGWFKVRVRHVEGKSRDGAIEGMLFRSLLGEGTRINLDDIVPAHSQDQDKLDDAIRTGNVDEADVPEISRLLNPVAATGMDWAVVYDVGQGNSIGLCEASGSVGLYFDFGGGVTQNSSTFPTALKKFCFAKDPPIVLSHWDHDHWSSWTRDNRCLSSEWLAPRQPLTALNVSLIAHIQGAGGKLWFLPRNFHGQWFGYIYLEVCNGSNRNNSGIALTISERSGGNGNKILMPGDADYRYIPSFGGGTQYLSVVVPHHGGKLKSTSLPACPGGQPSRLVYSVGYRAGSPVGSRKPYGHPRNDTIKDHDSNGWYDPIYTPVAPHYTRYTKDRSSSGLGHVLLGWEPHPSVPSLPCGALHCQLEAQTHQL